MTAHPKQFESHSPPTYAVIGSPIEHSLSPQIHQAFARQAGIELTYKKISVQPGTVAAFLERFRQDGGYGLNVTVPLKLEAFELATRRDELAESAQAVNTLMFGASGEIAGFNTDGVGLLRDLIGRCGLDPGGMRVVILGAGGATQGIVAPLLAAGPAQLLIANRTLAKAERLVTRFVDSRLQAISLDSVPAGMDLIINATSIGLQDDLMPVQQQALAGAYCYDMSYGANARFARWARDLGARESFDGLGMLVEQAAESFHIWHGHRVETDGVISMLRQAVSE